MNNNIEDNIIKTEHDYHDKIVKLHYKCNPDKKGIMQIIRYLNSTDWKNFKFNQYSVKENCSNYIITLNYVSPKPVFAK